MLDNPFDESLTPEAKERVAALKTFHEAQALAVGAVTAYETNRQRVADEWETAKREHHDRRLEEAEAKEDVEARYIPAQNRRLQEEADDRRFARVNHEDELLELKTHEDYLAGRRAVARRTKKTNLFLKVEVTPEMVDQPPPTWTARKVWGMGMGLLFGWIFLSILAHDVRAVVILPFLVLAWAGIVRLGLILFGGGGWGSTRGSGSV